MERISEALDRTLGVRLPLVPFVEWFDLLEKRAKLAGREDVENIVSLYFVMWKNAMVKWDADGQSNCSARDQAARFFSEPA